MRDERRQTVFTKGAVGLAAVRNRAIKHFYAYDISKQILSGGASTSFREELDRSECVRDILREMISVIVFFINDICKLGRVYG